MYKMGNHHSSTPTYCNCGICPKPKPLTLLQISEAKNKAHATYFENIRRRQTLSCFHSSNPKSFYWCCNI